MVKLVVKDYEFVSMLEAKLIAAKIDYDLELETKSIGIETPYLIVDGVPLNQSKAIAWIKERH